MKPRRLRGPAQGRIDEESFGDMEFGGKGGLEV
jgi:hypothetical protein